MKSWANELQKLATAVIAVDLVLTKEPELSLNDKYAFPQDCIDVFSPGP